MHLRRLILGHLLAYPLLGACASMTYECPVQISTVQSLREPAPGWREALERPFTSDRARESGYSQHNLDYIEFSVGVPEERVSLAPDRETSIVKGRWTATWLLSKSEEIWFSCRYRGTTVMLSRQLSPGLKACAAKYDKNRGITVQGVSCD
jgi:hypothetical protein